CATADQAAAAQTGADATGRALSSLFQQAPAPVVDTSDEARWGGSTYLNDKVLAPQVVSAQNSYLMTDMMSDVIRRGTGRRALQLKRNDLAGKTGTTNEQRDAWFCGFNGALVGAAWVGF